jgi:hypothetical protein
MNKKTMTMTIKFYDMNDGNVKCTVYAGTNNYLFEIVDRDRISALNRAMLVLLSNDETVTEAVNESLARRAE